MKRYSMQVWRDGDLEHVEDPNGEWVRWEDVEELQAALDRLHGRKFSERVYVAMLADNTSLREKVEELLKDKERLDWLLGTIVGYQVVVLGRETPKVDREWIDRIMWAEETP